MCCRPRAMLPIGRAPYSSWRLRVSVAVVAYLYILAARALEACDIGDRVLAYREAPGCTPTKRTCWFSGVVADGPGRNDAMRTIFWDDGYQLRRRVHASYVQQNRTGRFCASPSALSDVTSCEDDGCWRYADSCLDRVGGVTFIDGAMRECHEVNRYGLCRTGKIADICPRSCGRCESIAQCLPMRKTLARLKRFAHWGWYSQWHQDSVLHILLVHPRGLAIPPDARFFVEFGFRPLRGLLGGDSNSEYLRRLGWRGIAFDKTNEGPTWPLYRETITAENVVSVFERHGVPKELGIVTIDIDTCDFWVFLSLAVVYRPRIFQVEYNRHLRFDENVTLDCRPGAGGGGSPPDEMYGASIQALAAAGRARGYSVIWVERCFDVFFVRDDLMCDGSALPDLEAFRGLTLYEDGCHDPWGKLGEPASSEERRRWLLDLSREGFPG